ncbi:TlpA family protein disulfide reductase [Candidatus Berkelbacteria bacterium]|nr:TlpA family protein disulfide reductase [Candidatus Berkelbacteria bacterium]
MNIRLAGWIVLGGVAALGLLWLLRPAPTLELPAQGTDQATTRPAPASKERNFPAAPRFTLKDYEGNDVSRADFAGQPLIINSWATWCPFCTEELPDFAEIADEFSDQVSIVAINRGEPRQTAKDWTDVYRLTDRITFLLDPTDAWYEAIGGFGMPETLFIDGDGHVRFHARGPIIKEEFRRLVAALIDGTLGTEAE